MCVYAYYVMWCDVCVMCAGTMVVTSVMCGVMWWMCDVMCGVCDVCRYDGGDFSGGEEPADDFEEPQVTSL